jgi:7-carboxy-7-deazaguanine synthase
MTSGSYTNENGNFDATTGLPLAPCDAHARGVALMSGAKNAYRMNSAGTLSVNETFVSIQGEGDLIGAPTLFIRLDGCPLRCAWCDTPYALQGDAGALTDVHALAALAKDHQRVVITGGEPLAQDIKPLVSALRGAHVTVETSGTIFADLPEVALFSISPKVGSSGYKPKPAVLRKYFASAAGRIQLKFVIADERDLAETQALLNELIAELPPETPIILQPESGAAGRGQTYLGFLRWLTEEVLAQDRWRDFNVRVLPQLHYLLWEGVAGR